MSARRTAVHPSGVRRPARGPLAYAAAAGFAAWFWATVGAVHPSEAFSRIRRNDPTGVLIPNWRFFAPNPANVDYALIHRVEHSDGTVTPWSYTVQPYRRHWVQTFWFPTRRRSKTLFDLTSELLVVAHRLAMRGELDGDTLMRYPAVAAMREYVESVVRGTDGPPPSGFQFALVEHSGYDESEDEAPRFLFLSVYLPLQPAAVAGTAS
jgi:hypothetical protein